MGKQTKTYALYWLNIGGEQVIRHHTPIMLTAKESRDARKVNKGTAVHVGVSHPTILPFDSTLYLEFGEDFSWASKRKAYLKNETEANRVRKLHEVC